MSVNVDPEIDDLRQLLEAQLQLHTDELAALTAAGADPADAGEDPQTVTERISAASQAVAETTAALARIAQGTYGRCERCSDVIPAARLAIRPRARRCVPCQART
ncbi:TraR/DksA family transcriptional regulator [Dactylosporangium sp. NPDC048998]|uniref:TraR/DksA family transcriptional regulator n=1 Tax=Dactylosporangium sp. NPDC048998 TaxID=3363976 RepID=UPI003713CF1B